ncbi:MAG: PilZN3 domain-containing protein [Treponema sp.]
MSFATSQQINKYLELYKDVSITFSKEVIEVLSFDVKQAFVRASGGQWPCIINSASMNGAKIICNKGGGLLKKISTQSFSNASLRFSFFDTDSKESISFFVTVRLVGVSDYQVDDLSLVTLAYTQRAPDALIERLGRIIEANVNAKRHPTEKVVLTDIIMRRIALTKKETVVFVEGVPRRCIVQNISFVGATIYMMGVASFLKNKAVTLKFEFTDPDTVISIKGHTAGATPLEDRKDLVSLTIEYEAQNIPMMYKLYLNRYFELPKKLVAAESESPDAQN